MVDLPLRYLHHYLLFHNQEINQIESYPHLRTHLSCRLKPGFQFQSIFFISFIYAHFLILIDKSMIFMIICHQKHYVEMSRFTIYENANNSLPYIRIPSFGRMYRRTSSPSSKIFLICLIATSLFRSINGSFLCQNGSEKKALS